MVEFDMADKKSVTLQNIYEAEKRIGPHINRTPLLFSKPLSELAGAEVFLKMEAWQVCGCFKVRGAINKVGSCTEHERAAGIVTTSSGNHAIGVAYAAYVYGGIPTRIFMPEGTDSTHIEKVEAWGGECVLKGSHYQESFEAAGEYMDKNGGTYVHSHADPDVMAGQGTIGLEILEDLPEAEAVVVPIGGGGMISGIGTAITAASEDIEIFGVEPEAAPAAYRSFREGVCCRSLTPAPSIADGLLSGVHEMTWEIFRHFVKETVLVSEEELREAVYLFQNREQLMVEPAASIGLAALLHHLQELKGKKVVLIVTSRNIDAALYNRILREYETG